MAQTVPNGVRKSAILLLLLDQDQAAEVLNRLPPEMMAEVSRAIASLGQVELTTRRDVLAEFCNLARADSSGTGGGPEDARALLGKCLSEAEAGKEIKHATPPDATTHFAFLQKADSTKLLTFIQDEHPQTIALILTHLNPQKAREILVGLSSLKQTEVVKRIADLEQTRPEGVEEGERALRLSDMGSQPFQKRVGVDAIPDKRNSAVRSLEQGMTMESLEAKDPDLVGQIRRLMFGFEDILLVNDKVIQSMLKEIDDETLALALKTASQGLQDKIFKNLSERAAQHLSEDMQYMGPVRVSDVEQAQQSIVDALGRLEESGEIEVVSSLQ